MRLLLYAMLGRRAGGVISFYLFLDCDTNERCDILKLLVGTVGGDRKESTVKIIISARDLG